MEDYWGDNKAGYDDKDVSVISGYSKS